MGEPMKRKTLRVPSLAVTLLVFALCLVLVLQGVKGAGAARREEARRVTEDGLRRAVMSCYALEGRYPPTLDYILANYGVHLDTDAFYVDYRVYASNLMPKITVLARQ